MLETGFFYFFALLTLGGAVATITRRSAVMSAVSLTVSLLGVAGIFLLEGAEFLFAAQIILYIGGITLLFLFVIMLVNLDAAATVRQFRRAWFAVTLAGAALAAELIIFVVRADVPAISVSSPAASAVVAGNTEAISSVLLSRYAVPFELASVLLLAAIIGSVLMGQQRDLQNQPVTSPQVDR